LVLPVSSGRYAANSLARDRQIPGIYDPWHTKFNGDLAIPSERVFTPQAESGLIKPVTDSWISLADWTAQSQVAWTDSLVQRCSDRAETATERQAALVPAATWPQLALTGLMTAFQLPLTDLDIQARVDLSGTRSQSQLARVGLVRRRQSLLSAPTT
jgi:hypothetical protein